MSAQTPLRDENPYFSEIGREIKTLKFNPFFSDPVWLSRVTENSVFLIFTGRSHVTFGPVTRVKFDSKCLKKSKPRKNKLSEKKRKRLGVDHARPRTHPRKSHRHKVVGNCVSPPLVRSYTSKIFSKLIYSKFSIKYGKKYKS